MPDKPLVIVDIETTGSSASRARITEIGAIKIADGNIVDSFTSLVNPGQNIPAFITRLTGIDDAMVAEAPSFDAIAADIDAFFANCYFMAHNAVFDMSFIKRQMEIAGFSFRPPMLCSVKLSRALYPGVRGHSLEKIISRFAIETKERHRAYDDAKAVLDFLHIALEESGEAAFEAAIKKQLKQTSLPANFDAAQLEGIGNTPGVYIFKDKHDVPVYIGKSVSLRSRILSHFSQSTSVSKELRISQATHNLEVIPTDSEVEALLLESQLVKEKLPVYNVKLRKKREQTVLVVEPDEAGYDRARLLEKNVSEFTDPEHIFGIYDSRRGAKEAIHRARNTFDLCSMLLGMEHPKAACFRYQLGKCKGACIGEESPEKYNDRMRLAFQRSRVESWKFSEPVAVKITDTKALVVDHWIVTGEVAYFDDSYEQTTYEQPTFDIDSYKIISNFMRTHKQAIVPLTAIVS